MEVTRISIRGSGILSEDEPLGLQVLLDGFTFNQGDGEVILEDFDFGGIQYAEVYRPPLTTWLILVTTPATAWSLRLFSRNMPGP